MRWHTPAEAPCGGTHRLFGLTWAYHMHLANGGKTEGVWKDVAARTEQYIARARQLRLPNGCFSTASFEGREASTDRQLRLNTTGHIFEWLALALSDEELRQPWMEEAANALAVMILNNQNQGLDGGALYHGTHGLEIYRSRVFGPTPHPPLIPALPK